METDSIFLLTNNALIVFYFVRLASRELGAGNIRPDGNPDVVPAGIAKRYAVLTKNSAAKADSKIANKAPNVGNVIPISFPSGTAQLRPLLSQAGGKFYCRRGKLLMIQYC